MNAGSISHGGAHHVPDSFARACEECGTVAQESRYARTHARHLCERCFLGARKRRHGGVATDPYEGFVEALAEALDCRERETGLHSKRVATHTLLLAAHCVGGTDALREIYWGSLLHDIGKIGVPDAALLKPDRLSPGEWQLMRRHPEIGFDILRSLPALGAAAQIVLCHEERFDGTGYPRGLVGEAIPLAARLFAVIDTLDAMTFDRPYRRGLTFDAAKAEIIGQSGSQFDPRAVALFLREEAALREMVALELPVGAAH